MNIKEKITHIAKRLNSREVLDQLVVIYKSEGEEVLNSIYNLAVNEKTKQAQQLIDAITVALNTSVQTYHPEYWNLTL